MEHFIFAGGRVKQTAVKMNIFQSKKKKKKKEKDGGQKLEQKFKVFILSIL